MREPSARHAAGSSCRSDLPSSHQNDLRQRAGAAPAHADLSRRQKSRRISAGDPIWGRFRLGLASGIARTGNADSGLSPNVILVSDRQNQPAMASDTRPGAVRWARLAAQWPLTLAGPVRSARPAARRPRRSRTSGNDPAGGSIAPTLATWRQLRKQPRLSRCLPRSWGHRRGLRWPSSGRARRERAIDDEAGWPA